MSVASKDSIRSQTLSTKSDTQSGWACPAQEEAGFYYVENGKSLEDWSNMPNEIFLKINLSPEWDDTVTCQLAIGPFPKVLVYKPLLCFQSIFAYGEGGCSTL